MSKHISELRKRVKPEVLEASIKKTREILITIMPSRQGKPWKSSDVRS